MTDQWKTSPTFRYVVRAVVTAAIAGTAVAGTIWIDNPYVKIVSAAVGALAAYLGIGFGTPVEPFVGVTSHVEVPVPPAEPDALP